jgi:hypothetical protein
MLDRSFIGLETAPRSVEVEAGQLRFFARATGAKDPIYFDEAAARAAGHPALPASPTFLFCLGSLAPEGESVIAKLEDSKVAIDGRDFVVAVPEATRNALPRMAPLGRAGTPEEAAGAVYLFCIPESNYISGQVILVGGGISI